MTRRILPWMAEALLLVVGLPLKVLLYLIVVPVDLGIECIDRLRRLATREPTVLLPEYDLALHGDRTKGVSLESIVVAIRASCERDVICLDSADGSFELRSQATGADGVLLRLEESRDPFPDVVVEMDVGPWSFDGWEAQWSDDGDLAITAAAAYLEHGLVLRTRGHTTLGLLRYEPASLWWRPGQRDGASGHANLPVGGHGLPC